MQMELPQETIEIPDSTREKIREAILELTEAGQRPTNRAVRALARADGNAVQVLLRLYREGALPPLEEPWGVAGAELEEGDEIQAFLQTIQAAQDAKAIAAAQQQLGELVVRDVISSSKARVLKELLVEQRRSLAEHVRQNPGDNDALAVALVTPEVKELGETFMGIVNGRRRLAILQFVLLQAQADLEDCPNREDLGATIDDEGRWRPENLGLDPFGEPLEGAEVLQGKLDVLGLGEWGGSWIREGA